MKQAMATTAAWCLAASERAMAARAIRPPPIQASPISSASAPVVVGGRWYTVSTMKGEAMLQPITMA
ncbi:hypothetical protein D3C72_1584400 [compost metagenome]